MSAPTAAVVIFCAFFGAGYVRRVLDRWERDRAIDEAEAALRGLREACTDMVDYGDAGDVEASARACRERMPSPWEHERAVRQAERSGRIIMDLEKKGMAWEHYGDAWEKPRAA